MSELEKKFYEYFMSEYFNPKEPEKIAKELAEIAANYFVNCDKCMDLCVENSKLQKENTELSKTLSDKVIL